MQTLTANKVINLLEEMIGKAKDYENYAIGITDNNDSYFKWNRKNEMAMLSYRSHRMMKEAWKYFGERGMTQMPPIGARAKHLYIFRLDGKEFKQNIF